MSENREKIWVLGGNTPNADINVPWQENGIPNLSNSDVLIVDLNTIPSRVSIPSYEIRDFIRIMLMAKKKIYVILANDWSNHPYILENTFPAFPILIDEKHCDLKSIQPVSADGKIDEIIEYSNYVDYCSFFINGINSRYLGQYLNPESGWQGVEKYAFTPNFARIQMFNSFVILNVANQAIGVSASFSILDRNENLLHQTGDIIFLPPPTKITSSEGIAVLVNSLAGAQVKEEEPDWSKNIILPHMDELINQRSMQSKIINEAQMKIKEINQRKTEIENYKRLLWTNDKPLENTVKDAFWLLGFNEIRQGRSRELEDWVIDFQITKEYVHGVLEVKGREKKTSLEDMNQCDKWVKQYRVKEGKKVKGVFVPNQFRRTESENSKNRLKFEPNEIEFATDFNICVLPTVELFKAVVYVLAGNKLPREEIEKRMLEAKPLCTLTK